MDEAVWLEMRPRLNWQHHFGLARHSNKKNIAAKKIFWKKDKFNIGFDCGVTKKVCITEDLSNHPNMGYGRGKEENPFQLKHSFHLSTYITKGIHKFLPFHQSPVSKQFYSLLLIYMVSSDRMV